MEPRKSVKVSLSYKVSSALMGAEGGGVKRARERVDSCVGEDDSCGC